MKTRLARLQWAVMFSLPVTIFAGSADIRLVEAAKAQKVDLVRSLLEKHADPNASSPDGATALHWAAYWDDAAMTDLLLKARANVNAADDLGVTPLMLACEGGSSAMAIRLLSAGADANTATLSGQSALMACSRSGSAAAVEALLAHGAHVNFNDNASHQTALMWAVAERHPAVVKILLAHGADLRMRSVVTGQLIVRRGSELGARSVCPPGVDRIPGEKPGSTMPCAKAEIEKEGGSTALLFAARDGDVESARLLLSAGANVNDEAPNGNSALVLAAYSGQTETAKFLLDAGADPNRAGAGYTALHIAVLRGDLELVKALLAHHADPNARLARGTPVMRDNQDLRLSDALKGATPVWLAARFLELPILHALLAAGGDPLRNLDDGTTALMAAAGVGIRPDFTRRENATLGGVAPPVDDDQALEAVKLLLQLGSNIKAANADGDTALHGAAMHGYANVVAFLAANGADLRARNKDGQTPLDETIVGENNIGRHEVKTAEMLIRKLLAQTAP